MNVDHEIEPPRYSDSNLKGGGVMAQCMRRIKAIPPLLQSRNASGAERAIHDDGAAILPLLAAAE
jgi:hypothetical protein